MLQSHSLSPNQCPVGSTHWVPNTDISGMPKLDGNFRNQQHQCTTQTQMFHDSKVLECLIRILCEKKEYSNLLFWRYCGTRDLGCATWNTFVPIAWIRRIGVLELKLYVVKVYSSDPSGTDLSDFPSSNIFLLFLLRFSSPPQKNIWRRKIRKVITWWVRRIYFYYIEF